MNQVKGVWVSPPDGDILPMSPDLACLNLRVSADREDDAQNYSVIVALCSNHLKSTLSVNVYGLLINDHFTFPLDEQYTSFELIRVRQGNDLYDAKFGIVFKKENLTGTSILIVPLGKDKYSDYWT